MGQVPLPDSSTWLLFPNLAVIVLIMAVVFGGLYLIWREYKAYAKDQDVKRSAERETQRKWEEQQDALRDERWQNFIKAMQAVSAREGEKNREQLAGMAQLIDKMAASVSMLVERVNELSGTVVNHIAVDDARFEVLLSDQQRQVIDDKIAQPRNKRKT